MFGLDQETIDALNAYNETVVELAKSAHVAAAELLQAHKAMTVAGQGLQGFIVEIKARAGEREVNLTKKV